MRVNLTSEQSAELRDLQTDLLRVNSNRFGEWAVMLAYVGEGSMKVKIFDNPAARAMAQVMEDELNAYCNKCKKVTAQYMRGRFRVCGKCGRKVTVK